MATSITIFFESSCIRITYMRSVIELKNRGCNKGVTIHL